MCVVISDNPDLSVLVRESARRPERRSPAGGTRVPLPPRRWKTRVLLPLLILGGLGALLAYAARDALIPAVDVEVVPVVVKTGVAGGGAVTVQAPGWLEPDPFPLAVSALASGVVREVLVLEGEAVEVGQVVARLVEEDAELALRRAEAELGQRRSALRISEATRDAAQRDWDHPIERVRQVAVAEALLVERQGELSQSAAELAAAQARLVELEAEYRRLEGLHETGQAAPIEFIRAEQQYEVHRALVDAARARQAVVAAHIRGAEAEVVASKKYLELRIPERRALDEAQAEVGRAEAAVAAALAARDEAALTLARMEVRSPVAGVVMTRLVEPGAKLMLGADTPRAAQVVRLYDPARQQVRVDVPLTEAAAVVLGQEAEVVVDVFPDRVFRGRVTRLVHEADIQKNTLQVKVAIEDPPVDLKPETLARVRFLGRLEADEQAQRLLVPAALVRQTEAGTCVWLADRAGGVAQLRSVVAGTARQGDWVEVREGLRAGDRLIAGDPSRLRAGMRVRIVGEQAVAERP